MLKNQLWLLLLFMMSSLGFISAHAEPTNQNMMEILSSIEQMESEIRQIRGDTEEMSHELKDLRQRQRELYIDVDRRLRELELKGAQSSAPATSMSNSMSRNINSSDTLRSSSDSSNVTSTTNANETNIPITNVSKANASNANASKGMVVDRKEREVYNNAFDLLKEGRYKQSIQAFQSFMKQYPQSSYADNAQYWLGEANYVSRKYKVAVDEFEKVINSYPDSPKISGALLKLGFSYYELGDWKKARQTLQDVIKKYPADTSARLAETRLQRMQKEGH